MISLQDNIRSPSGIDLLSSEAVVSTLNTLIALMISIGVIESTRSIFAAMYFYKPKNSLPKLISTILELGTGV